MNVKIFWTVVQSVPSITRTFHRFYVRMEIFILELNKNLLRINWLKEYKTMVIDEL